MERQDYHQLELFSQPKSYNQAKTKGQNAFFCFLWTYEKTILLIVCFIITGIISFSLGVERGKRLMLGDNLRLDVAFNEQEGQRVTKKIVELQPTLSVKEEQNKTKTEDEVKEYIQKYTIQIASFRTKSYAQKEIERLKKKGLSPFILSKGNFSIICVGNFAKQELAKTLLTELKKLYSDSYIRRL